MSLTEEILQLGAQINAEDDYLWNNNVKKCDIYGGIQYKMNKLQEIYVNSKSC